MSDDTESVHKYPLPTDGDWNAIRMPLGAVPLCVQMQHGEPFMWARVRIDAPSIIHHFRVAGTGHDLGSNVGRHIGTIQLHGGAIVLHVFEEAKP